MAGHHLLRDVATVCGLAEVPQRNFVCQFDLTGPQGGYDLFVGGLVKSAQVCVRCPQYANSPWLFIREGGGAVMAQWRPEPALFCVERSAQLWQLSIAHMGRVLPPLCYWTFLYALKKDCAITDLFRDIRRVEVSIG